MLIRYETLRQKLKNRRMDLSLKQFVVADRMNVAQSALSDLEHGSRPNPTVELLAVWARALGGRLVIDVVFDETFEEDEPK